MRIAFYIFHIGLVASYYIENLYVILIRVVKICHTDFSYKFEKKSYLKI